MPDRTRLAALLAFCLLFGLSVVLHAQTVTGTINGTVSDPSGAVIPAATVTVTNQETGAKRTATTNSAGSFTFATLEPGQYSLSATAPGFKTAERTGITLHVADTLAVPLVVEVGTTTETITVSGGATMVQ